MLQPQTHGAGFAYYGLDACQLGFEQSASIPGQAVISTAAVRAAGAGDLVHKARPQKALERGVQSCRAHAEAAVGEIPRFLHDGISVLFAAGKSEEREENRGSERRFQRARHRSVIDISLTDTYVKRKMFTGRRRPGPIRE